MHTCSVLAQNANVRMPSFCTWKQVDPFLHCSVDTALPSRRRLQEKNEKKSGSFSVHLRVTTSQSQLLFLREPP